MAEEVTADGPNPVMLQYGAPERLRRGRLFTLLLLMSVVHFLGLGLLTSVLRPAGPAGEWVFYLVAFPLYFVVKLGRPVPFDPALFIIAVMLINSLLYGAVLTVGVLTIRRLLKR